jgi:tetratricopeptide (TPR) repeat protein
MKRVLVTFVLALTAGAMAQGTAQPPAQQPAQQPPAASAPGAEQTNIPTSQKVIKDQAEYNAYITALNMTDPAAKAAAMEAFVAQYPNSVVKIDALEQAMAAYQEAKKPEKVESVANQILQLDPRHVRALAIVTAIKQGQAQQPAQFTELRQLGERGLQALPTWQKPEGMTDADYQKFKVQMKGIFASAAGFSALQQKDYAAAKQFYAEAVQADPNNFADYYRLAVADLEAEPQDLAGFWYGAKAISLAQAQNNQAAVNSISPYVTSRYKKYHGSMDGWDQIVASAAQGTAPPPGFTIKPAPTVCELAANAVQQSGGKIDLSFSDRETVLSCRDKSPANKAAADAVWQDLQTLQKNGEAKLKIPVKVVAVPNNSTLEVAVGEENQTANKADMKVQLEKPMTKPPAVGATTDIIGVISDYTPDPFMFTMIKGELPAAKAPAKKTPPHHGATKKKKKAA